MPLAAEFLGRASVARGGAALRFADDAAAAIAAYDWPGNVRQLENAVARAVAITQGSEITAAALPEEIARGPKEPLEGDLARLQYREVVAHSRDRSSKEYLVALLKAVRGNVTQAAKRAGLERESLHRLLTRYGLRADDYRGK